MDGNSKRRTRKECNEFRKKANESIPKTDAKKRERERQKEKKLEFVQFMNGLAGKTLQEIELAKKERREQEIEKNAGRILGNGRTYEEQALVMDKAREGKTLKSLERKAIFFKVLEETNNESTARHLAGIYYATFLDWLKLQEFRERYENLKRRLVDKATEVIAKSLDENNVETAKFVLKHNKLASSDWSELQTIEVKQTKTPSWCDDEDSLLATKKLKELEEAKQLEEAKHLVK